MKQALKKTYKKGDIITDKHGREWRVDNVEYYYGSKDIHYYFCNSNPSEFNTYGAFHDVSLGTCIMPDNVVSGRSYNTQMDDPNSDLNRFGR